MGITFAAQGWSGQYTGMVIFDSRLFDRGHMVRRWAEGIGRTFEYHVIDQAPVNKRGNTGHGAPGMLRAGLSVGVERPGPRIMLTTLVSMAPHTRFVQSGTRDIIGAGLGKAMTLPINYAFMRRAPTEKEAAAGHTLHRYVRGQAANNFMGRALTLTAAKHPSLQGFDLGKTALRLAPVGTPGAPNPYPRSRRR